jgi:gluconate 5-dehydrogenase
MLKGPSFDLTGRIALITGSSRGIGLAFAEGLASAGAEVVINSNEPEELERARARLVADGARAHALAFDVTDRNAIEAAVEGIETEIGPIDILVANAGIQRRMPFVDFDADTYRAVMATNIDHIFFVGQAVARRMVPRGRGKIINTCSLNSEIGRQSIIPYTASKGAVKMLTKGMCVELARHGIQVNGIGPGYMKTEMNRALVDNPEFSSWVATRTPAGRWGELDEMKSAVVFLASDSSSFVNGQVIYVDGGLTSSM